MTLGGIHHSSNTDEWSTPGEFYDILNAEFDFTFDPCPLNHTFDGLQVDWNGRIFCNPPYSEVKKWIEKGVSELEKGNAELIVYLVFARTDTRWFHDYIYMKKNVEMRFVKGRLKFGNSKHPAPSPSMVIIMRKSPIIEHII